MIKNKVLRKNIKENIVEKNEAKAELFSYEAVIQFAKILNNADDIIKLSMMMTEIAASSRCYCPQLMECIMELHRIAMEKPRLKVVLQANHNCQQFFGNIDHSQFVTQKSTSE